MPQVITINEPRTIERAVAGLGGCRFQPPPASTEFRLGHLSRTRPLATNERSFVDQLVSACIREPKLSARQVGALSTRTRSALRMAALDVCEARADYYRLRGSHLTADERVYAAMRWRGERVIRRLARQAAGVPNVAAIAAAMKPFQRPDGFDRAIRHALGTSSAVRRAVDAERLRQSRLREGLVFTRGISSVFSDLGVDRAFAANPAFKQLLGSSAIETAGIRALSQTVGVHGSGIAASLADAQASSFSHALRAGGIGRSIAAAEVARAEGERLQRRLAVGPPWKSLAGIGRLTEQMDAIVGGAGSMAGLRAAAPDMSGFKRSLGDAGLVGAFGHQNIAATPGLGGQDWARLVGRGLRIGDVARKAFEQLEHTRLYPLLRQFRAEWRRKPALFVIELVSVSTAIAYLELGLDAGEEELVDALTPALTRPDVLASMRERVETAPQLSSLNRTWLLHALDDVEATEWELAPPGFHSGLEGAFRDAARVEGMLDSRGRFTLKSGRSGSADGAEDVIKVAGLDERREFFLCSRAYGKGNTFRHGAVILDVPGVHARRQVACLLLGLAIWLERFVDDEPMRLVAAALHDRTPLLASPTR